MPTTSLQEATPAERQRLAPREMSIDPTQIRRPAQIPPRGSQAVGVSSQGLVAVYCGTIPGDTDAQRAAKELLDTSPDTGRLSNADYVYRQLSALYKAELPGFQSSLVANVVSVAFVSGSSQGGYGAFHIPGSQTDFDRVVLDSLNASGTYSADSGLGQGLTQVAARIPHIFPIYRGAGELRGVLNADDLRLGTAKPAAVRDALAIAAQSSLALKAFLNGRNAFTISHKTSHDVIRPVSVKEELPTSLRLVHANRDILGLLLTGARMGMARQYLSTALFAAEIVESFQMLTGKADPARTDGEAVSRVLAFKLTPEIALVPGFNSDVTQQWWKDGHPDFVSVNTENDQSTDGNASGVMFLLFLTDYLGVPIDRILEHMPSAQGAPLAETYASACEEYHGLPSIAGKDGASAFRKMVSLLKQYNELPDGTLNLPANGNPFPDMPNAKQGGLFAGQTSNPSTLAQDALIALGMEAQLDQQLTGLKSTLQQIQTDLPSTVPTAIVEQVPANQTATVEPADAALGYGPRLPSSLAASLDARVTSYRAPQYDQALQQEFWPHVYNELPGTGPNTDRLEVITGTNQVPLAVQLTGTVKKTQLEPDGDLHIYFQPDDPNFPVNQAAGEAPLELEIMYAGPVSQQDATEAEKNYQNPFDISQLGAGTRILAAGPLIFDRAHGKPAPDGNSIDIGLEIHPLAGMTILSGQPVPQPAPAPTSPAGQLSTDLASAIAQLATLNGTLGSMTSLLQKMKGESPPVVGAGSKPLR